MKRYKIECAYVHESVAKHGDPMVKMCEATCTDVWEADSAEEAAFKCIESNARYGWTVTRIINVWVEADNYWACV